VEAADLHLLRCSEELAVVGLAPAADHLRQVGAQLQVEDAGTAAVLGPAGVGLVDVLVRCQLQDVGGAARATGLLMQSMQGNLDGTAPIVRGMDGSGLRGAVMGRFAHRSSSGAARSGGLGGSKSSGISGAAA
jgi:hypothetical protein